MITWPPQERERERQLHAAVAAGRWQVTREEGGRKIGEERE